MTYDTIEIRNTLIGITARYVNISNLGPARLMAQRLGQGFRVAVSQGFRVADVIDQTTGAIVASYEDGEVTYMDMDPYAGY